MEGISAKDLVIEFVKNLPDNLTMEQIMYRISFEQNLLTAQEQVRKGQVHSHEEVKELVKKWLQ